MRVLGTRLLAALAVVTLTLPACSEAAGSSRTAVASFYPLAYAARRILGPGWEVIDLTPPGTEAHDVELTLEARTAIEDADMVIYYGDLGFQPQVEAAVEDAGGVVVAANGPKAGDAREDPHLWLWPQLYLTRVVTAVYRGIDDSQGTDSDGYYRRYRQLVRDLQGLESRYQRTLVGPRSRASSCRHDVLIVPHEAFGYLVIPYHFRQFGLAGPVPEGEPTAARLAEAEQLIESGQAGAVFYEPADEQSRRVAESLAADAAVPTLPLSTLESQPPAGDYISVMEENLDSLREGLGCP
jgi:zinc transport system substrate-binding protein